MISVIVYKVYCLKDPRDDLTKYVGVTSKTLLERLAWHLKDCNKITKKGKWINELLVNGYMPEIKLLEETTDWEVRERYWIDHFGGTTYLLNGHPGGKYK